jgi:Endosomal/lysosomal potassium channel TMEM175
VTVQVSKRTSAPAAAGPDGEGSGLSGHLVVEPNAGGQQRDEVMRETLGDQEVGLAETTRLEALSDGTLAIIITLLVLEIHSGGSPRKRTSSSLAFVSGLCGGLRLRPLKIDRDPSESLTAKIKTRS